MILSGGMHMYQIAICDSIDKDRKHLIDICKFIVYKHKIAASIIYYDEPEKIINEDDLHSFHIIFLGTSFYLHNGIQIGETLRKKGFLNSIVFISSDMNLVFHAFKIHAFQYLLKPIHTPIIETIILDDIRFQNFNPSMVIQLKNKKIKIPFKDIFFIESRRIYLFIHLADDVVRYHAKISEILEVLPNGTFIRCHQSYIVNIEKIKSMHRYGITIIDNQDIPISKRYVKMVKQVLHEQSAFISWI